MPALESHRSQMPVAAPASRRWRHLLLRGLAITLLIKLIALIVMKTLWFSGDNRVAVEPAGVSAHFAIDANGAPARPNTPSPSSPPPETRHAGESP